MTYVCTACKLKFHTFEEFKIHIHLFHPELDKLVEPFPERKEYRLSIRLDKQTYNMLLNIKNSIQRDNDIGLNTTIKALIYIVNYLLSKGYTIDELNNLPSKVSIIATGDK